MAPIFATYLSTYESEGGRGANMAEYYQRHEHAKKLGCGRISARTIFPGPGKKFKIGTVREYPQGLFFLVQEKSSNWDCG